MNVVSIDVCVFLNISLYGCYRVLGDISFHCLYDWCVMHNGFMVVMETIKYTYTPSFISMHATVRSEEIILPKIIFYWRLSWKQLYIHAYQVSPPCVLY